MTDRTQTLGPLSVKFGFLALSDLGFCESPSSSGSVSFGFGRSPSSSGSVKFWFCQFWVWQESIKFWFCQIWVWKESVKFWFCQIWVVPAPIDKKVDRGVLGLRVASSLVLDVKDN